MSGDAAEALNFGELLGRIDDYWTPRVIAAMNDYRFKLAKLKGDFVWHRHEETDEAFIVLAGELTIELPDGRVELREGEMYVVPRGTEHRPRARGECHVLLVEPAGVVNTGNAGGGLTAETDAWI